MPIVFALSVATFQPVRVIHASSIWVLVLKESGQKNLCSGIFFFKAGFLPAECVPGLS